MPHKIKINISTKSKLLINLTRRINITAAGTTGRTRGQLTANLTKLKFSHFAILMIILMGIERLNLFPFKSIKMVGIEQFLILLIFHRFINMAYDL